MTYHNHHVCDSCELIYVLYKDTCDVCHDISIEELKKANEAILDYECRTCHDTGLYLYGNTAMNMGPGGQAMTTGPCPGTRRRPDLTDCPIVLRGATMMFCDYCGEIYDKSDDSRHDCLRELS